MATVTPPVVEASIDQAADARLHAMLQAAEAPAAAVAVPAPDATVQPATPVEPVPVPPEPATLEAAPVEVKPPDAAPAPPAAQPEVISIDLAKLPEEDRFAWQTAITKANGDPTKIAGLFWQYNNRLAQLSQAAVAPPEPPKVVATVLSDEQLAERVDNEAAAIVREDARVSQWVQQRTSHVDSIALIQSELGMQPEARNANPRLASQSVDQTISKLNQKIASIEDALADTELVDSPEKKASLQERLAKHERQLQRVERGRDQIDSLERKYSELADRARSSVRSRVFSEQEQAQLAREAETEHNTFMAEFTSSWPGYVRAAIAAANIGPELAEDFTDVARDKVLVAAGKGDLDLSRASVPATLPAYLSKVAAKYLANVDVHHRYQSAVNGRRAATPQQPVVIPDGRPTPTQTHSAPQARELTAAEIDARQDLAFQQALRAGGVTS